MPNNETDPWPRRERIIILALCFIAACRIFLFIAAFPPFNKLDEDSHFDLVYKYSQEYIPRTGWENLSREVAEIYALYGALEYLSKPEDFPDGLIPPPGWVYPNVRNSPELAMEVSRREQWKNTEVGSFPVYYMVAGLWFNIGRLSGIETGGLLYWIRFLNVPVFAVLVWFCYVFARTFFPDSSLQRVGLPLMMAFFPQDAFYSVSNDTFSPLLFVLGFFLLLGIYFEDRSHWYYLLTGLTVAATFLTKISNIAVLALLGVIVILKARELHREKRLKRYLPRFATLFGVVIVPIGIWLVQNYIVFGDITGSAKKVEHLGWTLKPLSELWDHPIRTAEGLSYFLTTLTRTFWRGELTWYGRPIAWRGADLFYAVSTAVFVLVCGLGLVLSKGKTDKRHRFVLWMSFWVIGVSVLFLAVLSVLFDFGDCWYPSRNLPYFVSGRLICGVLVPLLLIYLDGLGRIFSRLRNYVNPLVIVGFIVLGITCCEVLLTWKVFASPYNWFGIK